RPPRPPLFPYPTLFRSLSGRVGDRDTAELALHAAARGAGLVAITDPAGDVGKALLADLTRLGPVTRDAEAEVAGGEDGEVAASRSEEHTSELQSRSDLV